MARPGSPLDMPLRLPPGGDTEKAKKLLEKAEANCLVTNSLSSAVRLA